MRYTPGFAWNARWGAYGSNVDAHGICLYGDASRDGIQDAVDATGPIEHLDQAALTDHQKISFWFEFEKLRPYGVVLDLLRQVADLIESKGWEMAPAIDGIPDTGSDIGGLAETDFLDFSDKGNYAEADFPPKPSVQSYNAARSFSIFVEKLGTDPYFTDDEIAEIRQLALDAAQLVYQREFAEVE